MATAAVIGLAAGKRLLSTSFYPSDLSEKRLSVQDHGMGSHCSVSTRSYIVANKDLDLGKCYSSNRQMQALRALKEHVDTSAPSTADLLFQESNILEEGDYNLELSLEALLLLQKSMLEKQWNLSYDQAWTRVPGREGLTKAKATRSGLTARERRNKTRTNCTNKGTNLFPIGRRKRSIVSPELMQSHSKGYIRGSVSEDLLSHAEVINLSQKIKAGLFLEGQKKKLEMKLGCKPSDKQLASSLRISRAELHSKLIECSLAREKLAMSNVRLVMSIAQKYENMGAEMADLIQGGLIGLLRGIEKFDSSKGFRISTYVYWWIRQGVSKALVENSRTLRLPSHLHERLSSIRTAKAKLEEKGVAPSVDKIAKILNISKKKVRNATEADSKVFSLDREAFPALNGLPTETFHSYIADTNLENNPWHGFDESSLKDEVNKLLNTTLGERERDIIRLYYGLEKECHTWEEISRQFGLSRERVRQVGLVALEKLKLAARNKRLEAMLEKH